MIQSKANSMTGLINSAIGLESQKSDAKHIRHYYGEQCKEEDVRAVRIAENFWQTDNAEHKQRHRLQSCCYLNKSTFLGQSIIYWSLFPSVKTAPLHYSVLPGSQNRNYVGDLPALPRQATPQVRSGARQRIQVQGWHFWDSPSPCKLQSSWLGPGRRKRTHKEKQLCDRCTFP